MLKRSKNILYLSLKVERRYCWKNKTENAFQVFDRDLYSFIKTFRIQWNSSLYQVKSARFMFKHAFRTLSAECKIIPVTKNFLRIRCIWACPNMFKTSLLQFLSNNLNTMHKPRPYLRNVIPYVTCRTAIASQNRGQKSPLEKLFPGEPTIWHLHFFKTRFTHLIFSVKTKKKMKTGSVTIYLLGSKYVFQKWGWFSAHIVWNVFGIVNTIRKHFSQVCSEGSHSLRQLGVKILVQKDKIDKSVV